MMRVIIGIVLSIAATTALAQGDAARGKTLTPVCAACHGPDGNSPAGTFPSLAGQNEGYLVKQLVDIKNGDRVSPQMTGLLDNMSEQDFEDMAAWYASQEPEIGAAKQDLVALGEEIYRAGIARKSIAACTACHSPTGAGNAPASFPALSGQWPEYVEAQLKAFRDGERTNDGEGKMMRDVARDMSDDEIKAVSSYVFGLH
ncbi:MAG: cytochrome c4 [Pseudomonadales bacterium]|nr:cytochrome c4 [Pseudomonadales bacterium]